MRLNIFPNEQHVFTAQSSVSVNTDMFGISVLLKRLDYDKELAVMWRIAFFYKL
jgi:hypothetical protein